MDSKNTQTFEGHLQLGINKVTLEMVNKIRNNRFVNADPIDKFHGFVKYVTIKYSPVDDYGPDWIKVNIPTQKQLMNFYKLCAGFNNDICYSCNYLNNNNVCESHNGCVERM